MKGHGAVTVDEKVSALEYARRHMDRQAYETPFGFADDLLFDDKPTDKGVTLRLRAAILRDAAYGTAGSLFLRKHAVNSDIRTVFDGGVGITHALEVDK